MDGKVETLGQTLIPLINRLQDVFLQVGSDMRLDLPQVAVVGSQSSGKSSVLEALVGRDFLPRGNNIVTRRPLVLQLMKTTKDQHDGREWGEFLHCRGKKFYDFDRVRDEIEAETDRSVPSEKGISSEPIRLRIFSPYVLTMTLVDLPGMTRVPVGDQPVDIERQIRRLILKYISAPSCIILAVTPANQDLASSDALELAKKADPDGNRTIGVLTKLDIMDKGTTAVAALKNQIVPLRMGYVGVVLRSQHDVVSGKSMQKAKEDEIDFFRRFPEYDDVMSSCTIGTLARRLNEVLVHAIRESLPSLKSALEKSYSSRKKESKMYGEAPPGDTGAARGALLLSLLDSYSSRFSAVLEGRGEYLPVDEIAGGARIRHIFLHIFNARLDELDPVAELSDEEVRIAIKNSGGINGSLLIPEAPFEFLVRRAIKTLLAPALQCKEFIHEELFRIALQSTPPEVARFPKLQAVMRDAVEDFISHGAIPAEKMIKNHIQCEVAFVNTSHPCFIGGDKAIAQVLEAKGRGLSGLTAYPIDPKNSEVRKPVARTRPAMKRTIDGNETRNMKEPELFRPEDLISPNNEDESGTGTQSPDKRRWFNGWFGKAEDENVSGAIISDMPPSDSPKDVTLARPPETLQVSEGMSEQEAVQVEVTRILISSYFDIVRRNVQDFVPKIIMNFMVNYVQKGLQQHLTHVLYREDILENIMKEKEDVAEKRQRCQEALRMLRRAMRLLDTLPTELSSFGVTSHKSHPRPEDENIDTYNDIYSGDSPLRSGVKSPQNVSKIRPHRHVLSPK